MVKCQFLCPLFYLKGGEGMKVIKLKGFVKRMIYVGEKVIIFSLMDEIVGEVVCRVFQGESNFFYEIKKDLPVSLRTRLQGEKRESPTTKKIFIDNELTVFDYTINEEEE